MFASYESLKFKGISPEMLIRYFLGEKEEKISRELNGNDQVSL